MQWDSTGRRRTFHLTVSNYNMWLHSFIFLWRFDFIYSQQKLKHQPSNTEAVCVCVCGHLLSPVTLNRAKTLEACIVTLHHLFITSPVKDFTTENDTEHTNTLLFLLEHFWAQQDKAEYVEAVTNQQGRRIFITAKERLAAELWHTGSCQNAPWWLTKLRG